MPVTIKSDTLQKACVNKLTWVAKGTDDAFVYVNLNKKDFGKKYGGAYSYADLIAKYHVHLIFNKALTQIDKVLPKSSNFRNNNDTLNLADIDPGKWMDAVSSYDPVTKDAVSALVQALAPTKKPESKSNEDSDNEYSANSRSK